MRPIQVGVGHQGGHIRVEQCDDAVVTRQPEARWDVDLAQAVQVCILWHVGAQLDVLVLEQEPVVGLGFLRKEGLAA